MPKYGENATYGDNAKYGDNAAPPPYAKYDVSNSGNSLGYDGSFPPGESGSRSYHINAGFEADSTGMTHRGSSSSQGGIQQMKYTQYDLNTRL